MKSKILRSLFVLVVSMTVLLESGCGYMRNRGRDASYVFDLGISVNKSWKPQFALYEDFFNLLPLGYGNLDCKVIGMGNRSFGIMDYENHSWGWLAYGREKHGYGPFNPVDPQLAREDQRDLKERPTFDVGFRGAYKGEEKPPARQFVECNRSLHLGWIGIQNTMRPAAILDFILGWTTYDFLGDDDLPAPPKE